MLPTIKDIAKVAGVSHGTVSNVLNGKGNVSVEKIKLVKDAAEKLGYHINEKAQSLRQGETKIIAVVLPDITSRHFCDFYTAIEKYLTVLEYKVKLYTTGDIPTREIEILKEIASVRVVGIITISSLQQVEAYYNLSYLNKDRIIFVNREPQGANKYIGFDYETMGKDIGEWIENKGYNHIGIFTDKLNFSCENILYKALKQETDKSRLVTIQHVQASYNKGYKKAFEFFEEMTPEVIVVSDIEKLQYIKSASYFAGKGIKPQIICVSPVRYGESEQIKYYQLDYQQLGIKSCEKLLSSKEDDLDKSWEVLSNKGFLFEFKGFEYEIEERKITILTLPSPTTDALVRLVPHFKKITGIEVKLSILPQEEIYEILTNLNLNQHYDLIRFDMAWLSWFGASTFKSLECLGNTLQDTVDKFIDDLYERYSFVEGIPYALPFDPSVEMLFYRKDYFENPTIKRMYYEIFRKELELPTTFEELHQINKFFAKKENINSPTEYGMGCIYENSLILACDFLMRYIEKGYGIFDLTGNHVRLNEEEAIEVLNQYIADFNISEHIKGNWWSDVVRSLGENRTAMAIVFMNHISSLAHSNISHHLGYMAVPGNKPLLGGGVIGMSKYTQKIEEIKQFLKWVYSDEIATQISLLGGTSPCACTYENSDILSIYPWQKVAKESFKDGIRPRHYPNGKLLNLKRVEHIIGLGVKNFVKGIMTDREAVEYMNNYFKQSDL